MSPVQIDISPNQNGGILKKIIKKGVLESPSLGCEVEVSIKNVSHSPDTEGEVSKLVLGEGKIFEACELGIATMKIGEKAVFTFSKEYLNTYPYIDQESLELEIELIKWEYEDLSPKNDGGIRRIILTEGEGPDSPNQGAEVEIHLKGKIDDKVFDERNNVTFCIGEGSEYNIVKGIDLALLKCKKGEESKLILKPTYAFGQLGSEKFGIPPNAQVEYEVILKDFKKAKQVWELNDEEKIKEASRLKDKGNYYFKKEKLSIAIKMYRRAIQMLKLYGTY